MKIAKYCQRQRCKHVELEQFLACFRIVCLSATAGLSCYPNLNLTLVSAIEVF